MNEVVYIGFLQINTFHYYVSLSAEVCKMQMLVVHRLRICTECDTGWNLVSVNDSRFTAENNLVMLSCWIDGMKTAPLFRQERKHIYIRYQFLVYRAVYKDQR